MCDAAAVNTVWLLLAISAALVLVAGLVGVVFLWTSIRGKPAEAPSAPPPRRPPPPPADYDEEITVIGFAPMFDADDEASWADSAVRDVGTLGQVHTIAHDAGAQDDEDSAVFAVMLVSAVGQSHRGQKRDRNEDRYLALSRQNLFVVADGMGGYVGGQVAAQIAIDSIQYAFDTNEFEGSAAPDAPRDGAQLAAALQMANRAVFERATADPELEGMGTTLVAARFSPRKERMYVCHVGDSRCYRLRGGALQQLTSDHNLGQLGITGKNREHLTRAVGIAPAVEVDLTLVEPTIGDRYLLCSDGLTKMLSDDQIAQILEANPEAEPAVEALVQAANDAGGRDNVTCIVVHVLVPGVGVVPHDRDDEAEVAAAARERAEAVAREAAAEIEAIRARAASELAEQGEPHDEGDA